MVQDDALLANATNTKSPTTSPYEADSVSFTPAADLPLPTTSATTAAEVLSERGLRASGADHGEMKRDLQGWLDLVSLFNSSSSSSSPASLSRSDAQQSKEAPPSLSLRRILLPLALYPPPSLFTPSLREMELREEKESQKGVVEKSKVVFHEVVEAQEKEVKKEKEDKADGVGNA